MSDDWAVVEEALIRAAGNTVALPPAKFQTDREQMRYALEVVARLRKREAQLEQRADKAEQELGNTKQISAMVDQKAETRVAQLREALEEIMRLGGIVPEGWSAAAYEVARAALSEEPRT